MNRILRGILLYRNTDRLQMVKEFEQVRDHPEPKAVFFTCMDSRMIPTRFTETHVGDMFVDNIPKLKEKQSVLTSTPTTSINLSDRNSDNGENLKPRKKVGHHVLLGDGVETGGTKAVVKPPLTENATSCTDDHDNMPKLKEKQSDLTSTPTTSINLSDRNSDNGENLKPRKKVGHHVLLGDGVETGGTKAVVKPPLTENATSCTDDHDFSDFSDDDPNYELPTNVSSDESEEYVNVNGTVEAKNGSKQTSHKFKKRLIRNPGNVIPHAHHFEDEYFSCEPAALELGCVINSVRHIIVCGHSDCKAMNLLYQLKDPNFSSQTNRRLSPLRSWMCTHAGSSLEMFTEWKNNGMKDPLIFSSEIPTRKFVAYIDPENKFALEDKLSQIHTLKQISNVSSYGFLHERLKKHDLHIHALWFDIYTGDIYFFSRGAKQFVPVDEENFQRLSEEVRKYYS